jgi:toxin ParE1/3/4
MILIFTDAAERELEEIGDWIAQDNPDRAWTFVQELRGKCETLVHMPEAYPLVPRHECSGVRRRTHRNYLIFYRITDNRIEVLHVLHGARDYEPILFSGD